MTKNVFLLERPIEDSDLFSTARAIEKFGQPDVDPKKCKVTPNIEYVESPYPMRVYTRTEKLKVRNLKAHKIVAPYLRAAMNRSLEVYGFEKLDEVGFNIFSGDFVVRLVRGSKSSVSKHSFGIAFDFNANENGLYTPFEKARFGQKDCIKLLDIWQECGFANLGRYHNMKRDAMHFEFMKTADSGATK